MSSLATSATRPSGNNHDRRSPRQRVEALAYVGLGPENGGFPINVSEGGMAFQGIQPLEKDQLIHVNFKLPGLGNSVQSAAQIAWLNMYGKGGGLRFIDLPESTRRAINEWISLQTSPCGLTGSAPNGLAIFDTKKFQLAPDKCQVTNQDHSSAGGNSSIVKTALKVPLSPIAATSTITACSKGSIPTHSAESARDAGLPDPKLRRRSLKAWVKIFSRALITSLSIAAILGVFSTQIDGGPHLPAIRGNSTPPTIEPVVAATPSFQPESQIVDAPLNETTTPEDEVSPAVRAAKVSAPSEEKIIASKKISSPKPLPQHMGMNAPRLKPNLAAKSAAAEIAPPTLALPTNSALAAQLPTLFQNTPPLAPSAHGPAAQSGKLDAARLISQKSPAYPKSAQAVGLSGLVELNFIIGVDGAVHNVTVVKGNPLLARAAIEALQSWRYQPARRDGVAVESESNTVFDFKAN
jgi:TonB family protein